MPAGAYDAYEAMCEEERCEQRQDLLLEREMQDIYEDAVSKFYGSDITWKTAEAMFKLWAKVWNENEWNDPDAAEVAEKLGIGWNECYAALGKYDLLRKTLEQERKWWKRY